MCGCCAGKEEESPPPSSHSPLKKNVCCTDIIFLIIFIAFWGGMLYIAVFSIMEGDALRLVYGYDTYGNTCNRENNVKIDGVAQSGQDTYGLKNVFFMDYLDPFDARQVCVSKCNPEYLYTKEDVQKFAQDTGSKLCRYDIKVEDYLDQTYDKDGPCPDLPVFPTVALLNRCIPDLLAWTEANNSMDSIYEVLNADDIFRQVLSDLYSSWEEMILLCVIALVVAFLMVLLIRYMASIIVYVITFIAVVGSIAGTAFLWWTYVDTKNSLDADENLDIPLLSVDIKNETAFLVFAIVATVLTVILLLIILVMRKRVALVIALFHEAGKCLGSIPLLLIQPLWTFLVLFVFFIYWVIILGYISTAGYPEADPTTNNESIRYVEDDKVRFMWWYHVVGLIWTAEFILACQQMVICGSVAQWYFTRNKKELSCTVGKATCRLILHHIGSVALGSFIITLVKIPRLILMYIQNKFKGSENAVAQCILKCCICCLWCLEQCLKFLNQNAYTIISIEKKSFCSAARRAFTIIANNVLRVAAINSVGDFVLFLGKVGVMAITGAVGIVWLKSNPNLHYYAIPVLLCCVFAFLIAHCFLTIYEMVVDTLLLCFCEDCQMNDGTPEKQYFMSAELMKFVKEASLKIQEEEGTKDMVDAPLEGEKTAALKSSHEEEGEPNENQPMNAL